MRIFLTTIFLFLVSVAPTFAQQVPFGGPILPLPPGVCQHPFLGICRCVNDNALYIPVGPPRSGAFVWTPFSRTYAAGSPRYVGQWVAGLASVPYYCVSSTFPVIVLPARYITTIGTGVPRAATIPPISTTTPPWRYPQFTTAAQYDAEVDRLEAAYQACLIAGPPPCSQHWLAVDIAAERGRRFGPRPR